MSRIDRSNRIRPGRATQRRFPAPKVKISGETCSKDNDSAPSGSWGGDGRGHRRRITQVKFSQKIENDADWAEALIWIKALEESGDNPQLLIELQIGVKRYEDKIIPKGQEQVRVAS